MNGVEELKYSERQKYSEGRVQRDSVLFYFVIQVGVVIGIKVPLVCSSAISQVVLFRLERYTSLVPVCCINNLNNFC